MVARPSQWDLIMGSLDPAEGSEQAGRRPLLVVSPNSINWSLPIVTVLPLTSRKTGRKVYWTEMPLPAGTAGLPRSSLVMVHQIRTVSQTRLTGLMGRLEAPELRDSVLKLLSDYFRPD